MKSTTARPRNGYILLVVLGAVVALSALLFGFAHASRSHLAQADGFYRSEQAWTGAWGGLQAALAVVRDVNSLSQDPQTARLQNETVFSVGDARCTLVVTAESGLLNVNRLSGPDGRPDRPRIEVFLRLVDLLNRQRRDLPAIGYGIVPAILDWIDSDNDLTHLPFVQQESLGAENDYYAAQPRPYPCRNRPVDLLEELLPVKGMTPAILARLRPYLTCVSDGRIDLNTAPKLIVQSLSEQMDATVAEMIVRHRTHLPLTSLGDLRRVPGTTDNLSGSIRNLITFDPTEQFYRVRVQAAVQEHRCTIEALLRKNPQASTVDILYYQEL